MFQILLLLYAVSSPHLSSSLLEPQQKQLLFIKSQELGSEIASIIIKNQQEAHLNSIQTILQQEAPTLNPNVVNKILSTLKCADDNHVEHSQMITVIDYSLPSSEKRLWIFDLAEKKLLFNTYVSHGLNSGVLLSNYFSNKFNSKASSIGVYKTVDVYYGRHGLSLKLNGLEQGFNDNASNRSVVMHGGWYVDERFIKKYGRAGRSWGCPAVPESLKTSIINTIKHNSLFVVYYPSDRWFLKSKFLSCSTLSANSDLTKAEATLPQSGLEYRGDVLFAEKSAHFKHAETPPIVVMSADNYEQVFKTKAPLERMLRRQINDQEYIALSNVELKAIATHNNDTVIQTNPSLNDVYFVIPELKMVRGYVATEMNIVNLGKIKDITYSDADQLKSFTVHFDTNQSIRLRATNQFIRWLGL